MAFHYLLCLPNELILIIAEYLSRDTLNSLLKTSHRLHSLLVPLLYSTISDDKDTLLKWAALNSRAEFARVLLGKGADPTKIQLRYLGLRPLDLAALSASEPVARLLLEHGADARMSSFAGWTPLSWAVIGGSMDIVQLLLERGVDINHRDRRGRTALHWAAACGHDEIFLQLVNAGADVFARDSSLGTVMHWVVYGFDGAGKCLLLGRDAGYVPKAELELVVGFFRQALKDLVRQERMVDILLGKGVDIDVGGSRVMTVLHHAARDGNEGLVRMLLEKGADTTRKSSYWLPSSNSTLFWAKLGGSKVVYDLVLEKTREIDACKKEPPAKKRWFSRKFKFFRW